MKHWLVIVLMILGMAAFNSCEKCDDCKGPRKTDCIVTHDINPVCGCDGITYENASYASCAGVRSYTPGACNSGR